MASPTPPLVVRTAWLVYLLSASGCGSDAGPEGALDDAPASDPVLAFVDRAPEQGMDRHALGRGVAVFDHDGDGDEDLLQTAAYDLEGEHTRTLYLWRNDGGLRFTDVTVEAGLSPTWDGWALVAADFDNDGDVDVVQGRDAWMGNGTARYFRNLGQGVFEEAVEAVGLVGLGAGTGMAALDFDGDGWLDLYQANGTWHAVRQRNFLYRNRGDGTFEEVGAEVGIDLIQGSAGAVAGDFDGDGDPDLYTADWGAANEYYRNDGATFTTSAGALGDDVGALPLSAFMPLAFDPDGDGDLDLFVGAWLTGDVLGYGSDWPSCLPGIAQAPGYETHRFFENDGRGRLVDRSGERGVDFGSGSMGLTRCDLDLDGHEDVLLGAGGPDHEEPNGVLVWRDGAYEDLGPTLGLDYPEQTHGIACADFDGDGDLDVFLNTGGACGDQAAPARLLENLLEPRGWLRIVLEGTASNRDGIGAEVRVTAGGRTHLQVVQAGEGFLSTTHRWPTFGLGDADRAERVEVRWPSGAVQTATEVPAGWVLRLVEP